MKTILITGAAGAVGSFLRKSMAGRYRLRLSDIVPIDDLAEAESFVPADIRDLDAMVELVRGVDGIVHLGGISKEAAWQPILENNIVGVYNVYEVARRAGVERVIFATSNHAVGFYERSQTISDDVTVRPDSRYGVSKAFGEALGALYADKYGLRVLAIRIGNVAEKPVDLRRLSIWLSPRDLDQLVEIGLTHPALRFEVVYGMSDNARAWWDNSNAVRLGYQPRDRSEDYAAAILAGAPAPDPDSIPDRLQGGDFTVVEEGGGAPKME